MSRCDDLEKLKGTVDWAVRPDDLRKVVDAALGFPAPKGNPGQLGKYASTFARGGGDADDVYDSVMKVSRRGLPEVWVGTTSSLACDVISADAKGIDDSGEVLTAAGKDLGMLGDEIGEAKTRFAQGHPPLSRALSLIGEIDTVPVVGVPLPGDNVGELREAQAAAREGIDHMCAGWAQAEEAARQFVRQMNQYSARAKAERMHGNGMTAADKIVLGEASVPGAINDETILSITDMDRASAAMNRLSPDERKELNTLLAQAKSSQERAYILKALAAGHSLDAVKEFDRLIHPHADDPAWLRDRLSPASGQSNDDWDSRVLFDGKEWTQGQHPTCVASSTVLARAMVDPLYALQLTTGGHPGDPKFDNGDAFAQRLRDEQQRVYEDARPWNADLPLIGYDGVDNDGGEKIADSQISPYVGGDYDSHGLDNADDRRDVLPDIYNAVDNGKPVPVTVQGEDGGHQMMIIGHDGNRLQIYNPWGHTIWITEDDFINNHMDKAASGLPEADLVHLPR